MLKKICLLVLFLYTFACYSQTKSLLNLEEYVQKDSLGFIQIKTNLLFNSNQIISVLILPKRNLDKFKLEYAYGKKELVKTSLLAKSKNALAAINGGFFNMDSGGSVTYFEINDSTINRTITSELKWAKPTTVMNGAVVLTKDNKFLVQAALIDNEYQLSKNEASVLVTGPLLLLNSEKVTMPNNPIVKARHPRTLIGITKQLILLIAIDGRSKEADGISLLEAQVFLLSIGCVDAVNLDGGGSTTMWLKQMGIVNNPSDKTGERAVSNALLILNK